MPMYCTPSGDSESTVAFMTARVADRGMLQLCPGS
jgi:hypothetical protein